MTVHILFRGKYTATISPKGRNAEYISPSVAHKSSPPIHNIKQNFENLFNLPT